MLVKRREFWGYVSSNFDDIYFTHVIQVAIKHSVHRHQIQDPVEGVTTLPIIRNKFS